MSSQSENELNRIGPDGDPQETAEWLEALQAVIEREGPERAHYLIENLVDFNQAPHQELNIEQIHLPTLWEEILAPYRITIENKGLKLTLKGAIDEWPADQRKLRTTLDNLLSNAVNYTPEKGAVKIKWLESNGQLKVMVANSGEPIPQQDAERIFEPFVQSAAKRTGPLKGSGIGLSVARECMLAQGGSLTLEPHGKLPVCFQVLCPAP